ncbi:hypothetical protein [Mycobacterium lepromatosis]|uniref:hypothetical protein n=1 Tax=Mycobacterium lepromatosis TaxID=480418 RepID=UPI001585823A|nr:hypothetical protein [Mycobacterium lepromatosis]
MAYLHANYTFLHQAAPFYYPVHRPQALSSVALELAGRPILGGPNFAVSVLLGVGIG